MRGRTVQGVVLIAGCALGTLSYADKARPGPGAAAQTASVEQCRSCHPDARKTHPEKYLVNHPPDRFSCAACHHGDAKATRRGSAHGQIRAEIKPFIGLDDPEEVTRPFLAFDAAQSACFKCHREARDLPGAPLLAQGARLFRSRLCFGCHVAADLEEERKPGPDLTNIGLKTDRDWIVRWLKNPRVWLANATMPNFLLSDPEAFAIADYLLSLREEKGPAVAWEPFLSNPQDQLSDEESMNADRAFDRGKAIWGQARCSACHNVAGVVGAFEAGPDLNRVAGKVNRDWLYGWLKDPRRYYSAGLMPQFRLSDEDIKTLVYYLTTDEHFNEELQAAERIEQSAKRQAASFPTLRSLQNGKQLVTYYGCAGCHTIKNHEKDLKIGPALTDLGVKPLKHFNFGNLEFDREAWIKKKLTDPRFFQTRYRNLRMPDPGLSVSEATALRTLLLSLTDDRVPSDLMVAKEPALQSAGEFSRLLGELKCTTCHSIRGVGGRFAPDLSWEGSKLNRAWFEKFVKSPDIIRPLLQQMPRLYISDPSWEGMPALGLSDPEVQTLADYVFRELVTDKIPRGFAEGPAAAESQVDVGRSIYERKGCFACHQIGMEGGAVGPELTAVGDRLQPGYIFALLKRPQTFDRHMVMPNYGLSDADATALTRFLMTLKAQEGEAP
ncbi:MAG: c-type cytochrome [Acidobacteria bacterium]|nr:c-type cytochrome [Acidobacteriota bacterium]